jgi:hypothetical protein
MYKPDKGMLSFAAEKEEGKGQRQKGKGLKANS